MSDKEDLYSTLGVDKQSSEEQIKKAFKKKAKESHPDKGGDKEKFVNINKAYQILSDDSKRKKYDETGQIDDFNENDAATNELLALFNKVIESYSPEQLKEIDIIRTIKIDLNNTTKNINELITRNGKYQKDLKKIIKRVNKKKDTNRNIFLPVVEAKIKKIETDIFYLERQKLVLKKAEEIVDEYEDCKEGEEAFALMMKYGSSYFEEVFGK